MLAVSEFMPQHVIEAVRWQFKLLSSLNDKALRIWTTETCIRTELPDDNGACKRLF